MTDIQPPRDPHPGCPELPNPPSKLHTVGPPNAIMTLNYHPVATPLQRIQVSGHLQEKSRGSRQRCLRRGSKSQAELLALMQAPLRCK